MTKSVYLAGPITGLTYDDGADWRESVAADLADVGIEAFSPLRAKNYLREFGELQAGGSAGANYVGVNPLSEPQGITTRDRFDTTGRDVVLANLVGAERVSIGTMIELGWADASRTPIILAMEPGNIHAHAMVEAVAGYIVPTLDEAVAIVKAILLP